MKFLNFFHFLKMFILCKIIVFIFIINKINSQSTCPFTNEITNCLKNNDLIGWCLPYTKRLISSNKIFTFNQTINGDACIYNLLIGNSWCFETRGVLTSSAFIKIDTSFLNFYSSFLSTVPYYTSLIGTNLQSFILQNDGRLTIYSKTPFIKIWDCSTNLVNKCPIYNTSEYINAQNINNSYCNFHTTSPSKNPTLAPVTHVPTKFPTIKPSIIITNNPTTFIPTLNPSIIQTNEPSTLSPTSIPSTSIPSTSIPSTSIPSTFTPSTFTPSTFTPSTSIPSTFTPSTFVPSTFTPSTLDPSTLAPFTFTPSTLIPSTLAPSTFTPSTLASSTLTPSTLAPSTLAPSTLAPFTFTPSTLAPSTLAPSTFIPSTSTPSTSTPSTFTPSTFTPSTFTPSTLASSTFTPSTFLKNITHSINILKNITITPNNVIFISQNLKNFLIFYNTTNNISKHDQQNNIYSVQYILNNILSLEILSSEVINNSLETISNIMNQDINISSIYISTKLINLCTNHLLKNITINNILLFNNIKISLNIDSNIIYPMSEEEKIKGIIPQQVIISKNISSIKIKSSLIVTDSKFYKNAIADNMQLTLISENNITSSIKTITFVLQNKFVNIINSINNSFITYCKKNPQIFNYTCPGSNYIINHNCTNVIGIYKSYCPLLQINCNSLSNTERKCIKISESFQDFKILKNVTCECIVI